MAVNKVIFGENTLIDLTADTVTASALLSGYKAHDKSGALITGTLVDDEQLGYAALVGINYGSSDMIKISSLHPNISVTINQSTISSPSSIKINFYIQKYLSTAAMGNIDVFLDYDKWSVSESTAIETSGAGSAATITASKTSKHYRFKLTNMPTNELYVNLKFSRKY